jgi:hypothetical protein
MHPNENVVIANAIRLANPDNMLYVSILCMG